MAKWNETTTNTDDAEFTKKLETEVGISMLHCLSNEEQAKLSEDWKAAGGLAYCPWWKFCFDNIKVSYKEE